MYTTNQLFKVRITHMQWFNMGVGVMKVAKIYTTNQLFRVGKTNKQWFNMGAGVMNVAHHLDVHD